MVARRGAGAAVVVTGLLAVLLLAPGLGQAPFDDPGEGQHAEIAREMLGSSWIALRLNGVRYWDKPPLLYWLTATSFTVFGIDEWAARLPSLLGALLAVAGTALLGARLLGSAGGLLAGAALLSCALFAAFARYVRPETLFVAAIQWGFTGLLLGACQPRERARDTRTPAGESSAGDLPPGRSAAGEFTPGSPLGADARTRPSFICGGPDMAPALPQSASNPWWAILGCGTLGVAALAKDPLGMLGPLAAVAVALALAGRLRPVRAWMPALGVVSLLVIGLGWYAVAAATEPSFLWYTVVDNHLLNVARMRVYPDEDVPLSALEFLAVTAIGFLPWCLAVPWALWRRLRGPWPTPEDRAWLLLAIWAAGSLAVFTLSPFKLPHYGLPAFPALALLVAKLWDEVLEGAPGAPSPRTLLAPPLLLFAVAAGAAFLAWRGYLTLPAGALPSADVAARNVAARGPDLPFMSGAQLAPLFRSLTAVFGLGALAAAAGLALRRPTLGLGALLAAMLAFLPFAAEGFELFARSRSVRMLGDAVALRAVPGDLFAHEGALENSGSWLLTLDPPGRAPAAAPVKVVNGLVSNLAFGASFPEARDTFWDADRLAAAWRGDRRIFLLSATSAERSVTRTLPPDSLHLLLEAGGRRLYSNRP